MTDKTTASTEPTNTELKAAIAVHLTITREFAALLDRAFPDKDLLNKFNDIELRRKLTKKARLS